MCNRSLMRHIDGKTSTVSVHIVSYYDLYLFMCKDIEVLHWKKMCKKV